MRAKDNLAREQPPGVSSTNDSGVSEVGQQTPKAEQPEYPGDSQSSPGVLDGMDIEFEALSLESESRHLAVPVIMQDENFSNIDIAVSEQRYKVTELQQEAVPFIKDAVEIEVKKAVKKDIGHRLDKYEKRRNRRFMANIIGTCMKWGIAVLIALTIYGNVQLRTRVCIVAKDVKEIVICLINNKEVSFDKLVKDLFSKLDDSLDNEDRAS